MKTRTKLLATPELAGALVLFLGAMRAASVDSYTATDLGTVAPFGINNQGDVVGAASFAWSAPAHACIVRGLDLIDLGSVGSSTYSQGQAINDNGQVVGYFDVSNGWSHAFLYSDGKMQDLGTVDANNVVGVDSFAYAINKLGQVVGTSTTSTGTVRAFVYSAGTMTDLGTLGGLNSYGQGINSKGEIVGAADTASGETHVFLYSSGVMKDLGINGGASGGINDNNQIAGTFTSSDGSAHPYIYSAGVMRDLAPTGPTNSYTFGLNNQGQVVGWFRTNEWGGRHAFLYTEGQIFDLNTVAQLPSGWILSSALGINDHGWIVCSAVNQFSLPHTFLLRPVVQPPSLSVLMHRPNLVLSWPAGSYVLERTAVIDSNTIWTAVTNAVVISGTDCYFTNSLSNAAAFFRLRK